MGDQYPTVKVAAVQAASVFLDREASTEKACRLIREAGKNGARVIGFPEGFGENRWKEGFESWISSGSKERRDGGWKEGQGLGKKNTGMTDIIHVEARNETAGLGMKSAPASASIPGESYKDAVKRAMAQRFHELNKQ